MRILFVRHGNPDYELDCLTELGKQQAEALSHRLVSEGIERIYSSTCGRALETAGYTAEKLGLDIIRCDSIREISWSSIDGAPVEKNGNPWLIVDEFPKENKPLVNLDWRDDEVISRTKTADSVARVAKSLDELLDSLGYTREGYYYRVGDVKYKTIAIFSHAGAFAAMCTHIFNLPMPFVLRSIYCKQSGVIEVSFEGGRGEIIAPRFGLSYEISHLLKNGIEAT